MSEVRAVIEIRFKWWVVPLIKAASFLASNGLCRFDPEGLGEWIAEHGGVIWIRPEA